MNRRKFLTDTTKYAMAAGIPFILPSGRLFAATGDQKVKHVVYCMFAGGIRNWESIDFKEGNLMPNTLEGDHNISQDILPAMESLPRVLETPLQKYGTLLKGFEYISPTTLHFFAHSAAITGKYSSVIEMMKPIPDPSVFEYFRKHHPMGERGLNAWWITDQAGPFPFLQYSLHPQYGQKYAANMIQPSTFFGFNYTDPLPQKSEDQIKQLIQKIDEIRGKKIASIDKYSPINSEADQDLLKKFINNLYQKSFKDKIRLWEEVKATIEGEDFITIYTTCEVLKTFKPSLIVVNIQDSDIAHSNFTDYCKNLNKADYALAKLWQTIQEDEELKDNTVLIVAPEFGRNSTNNSLIDSYGRFAVDHTGDPLATKMFCLIAGPKGIVQQDKVITDNYGELIDIVPTIAHLMGFREDIPSYFLNGKVLNEALV